MSSTTTGHCLTLVLCSVYCVPHPLIEAKNQVRFCQVTIVECKEGEIIMFLYPYPIFPSLTALSSTCIYHVNSCICLTALENLCLSCCWLHGPCSRTVALFSVSPCVINIAFPPPFTYILICTVRWCIVLYC